MRVALDEPILTATAPAASFAVGREVRVLVRGTEEEAEVYSAESGGALLAQPLRTGEEGIPLGEADTIAWAEEGSYVLEVLPKRPPENSQRIYWEAAKGGGGDLSGYQQTAEKGEPGGYAGLDGEGKVAAAALPAIAIGEVFTVGSQVAQLALAAQEGDVAVRTDQSKSYIHNGGSVGTMADWTELRVPADAVLSVAGKTGAVSLGTGDIEGLTAALAGKQPADAELTALAAITPKSGDTLVGSGGTWAALGAGESGQLKVFRSDGTISWQTPPAIWASAFGLSTAGTAAANTTALQAAADRAAEKKRPVSVGNGTFLINKEIEADDEVTVEGAGKHSTTLKVAAGAKCGCLKTKRAGAGGETGGAAGVVLRRIEFDGNLAENAGSTATVVDLDGIRPILEDVAIRNGKINLRTRMSRNLLASGDRLEDGYFNNLELYDSKEYNWLHEGPHDSQISNVWARTDEGVNLSSRSVSVWSKCHAYGNGKYNWEIYSGTFYGCLGEGASTSQVIFLGSGIRWYGGWIFSAGLNDGKVGITFGDATHSAFNCRVYGVEIENCTVAPLKFVHHGGGSVITGCATGATGSLASGTWNTDVDFRGMRVTGGMTDNTKVQEVASTWEFPAVNCPILKVSGNSEVATLLYGFEGQELTLRFLAAGCKLNGSLGNLKLASAFVSSIGDTITFKKEGSAWYEVSRKQSLDRYDRDLKLPGLLAPTGVWGTGTLVATANRAYFMRVVPSRNITIKSVRFVVTVASTADDACDVGIYDASLNRLRSAGATTGKMNSAGAKTIEIPSIELQANTVYFVALSYGTIGGTAATLVSAANASGFPGDIFGTGTIANRMMIYANTSHPLPVGPVAPSGSIGTPWAAIGEN
jgi:hypothetical protein